ncbi:UDP-glycosyltransferase 76F1 [Striga hermonthica]|uniref:UDP-glycosyltransferase 76F1 n=1 Tax=Striga hermonthica TaxID=68872 RepID=A0A9N7MND5_STRHE|nr:UDP-glycosyltransferase 76F1 [Striga hermonthica]
MENSREQPEQPQQPRTGGQRLILFPLPLQGHISPMLQLANILHSRGFSITIIHARLNSPNPSNHPHFTFRSIHTGISEIDNGYPKTDTLSLLEMLNVRCVEPFRLALTDLLTESWAEPVACVVSDAILHFTSPVCASLKVPRFVLRTGGVCSFLAFAAFPSLLERGYLHVQEEKKLEDPVEELPPLRIKDLPVINTSHPEKLYELVQAMVEQTKASSGLIFNSFQELEDSAIEKLSGDFEIPIFPIGPFHKHLMTASSSSSLFEEDHSSISWLDKQPRDSVIYVSFGSIAAIEEKDFVEVAWGLADSKHPFLWVVRPGLVKGSDWLEPLPKNYFEMVNGQGYIVKWAPQMKVLSHPSVGAFWTHCGWNSTLESVCEGVPMICSPCFTDQLVNARYVGHVWQVGLCLEGGFRREEIEMAIEKIMGNGERGEFRGKALDLKVKSNHCVEPGGSSYRSLQSLVEYLSLL